MNETRNYLEFCAKNKTPLVNRDFSNLDLEGIDLQNADLKNINFICCNLENSNFKDSYLFRVNFMGSSLSNSNFEESYLEHCNFQRVGLNNSSFEKAEIYSSDFYNAYLKEVNLLCKVLNNSNFKSSYVEGIKVKEFLPKEGPILGYFGGMRLFIPEDAKRINILGSKKCRASKVVEYDYEKVVKIYEEIEFDPDITKENSYGYNFFLDYFEDDNLDFKVVRHSNFKIEREYESPEIRAMKDKLMSKIRKIFE